MKDSMQGILHEVRTNNDAKTLNKLISRFKFIDFLTSYTLHDSCLKLILADDDNFFTMGIKWDTFWNKDKLSYPGAEIESWPALFISFPTIYRITWDMFQGDVCDTILEVESERFEASREDIKILSTLIRQQGDIGNDRIELTKTTLKCVSGKIEIIHEDPVEFLCVGTNGETVKLEL